MTLLLQSRAPESSPCDLALRNYDAACLAIRAAADVDEVKDILDRATAIRAYARQTKNADLQNLASKIRIRAQFRLGQLLKASLLNDGNDKNNRASSEAARLPKLEKMGITQKESCRCQRLASVSEERVEKAMASIAARNEEVTTAAVSRAVLPKTVKKVCGITEKNVEDTRCLSMAMLRLRFCREKVELLVASNDARAKKVLCTYRQALLDFSSFIQETLATIPLDT